MKNVMVIIDNMYFKFEHNNDYKNILQEISVSLIDRIKN